MDCSEEPRGIFLVIDNKSFYATVECTMRGLDPLTTPLVVMSEAENTNGGLVLASSPMAKKLYGISNVNRQRDLPRDNHLIVVPPRMNRTLKRTLRSTTSIASSWPMRTCCRIRLTSRFWISRTPGNCSGMIQSKSLRRSKRPFMTV